MRISKGLRTCAIIAAGVFIMTCSSEMQARCQTQDSKSVIYYDDDETFGQIFGPSDQSMERGQSRDVSCIVNSEVGVDVYITWSSSDAGIVSVDGQGYDATLYANRSGSATITVDLFDDFDLLDSDCFTVNVKEPQPQHVDVNGISISRSSLQMYTGDSYTLGDTISPSNATNQGSSWSSGNESVVRVTSDGTCYAAGEGNCTVKVTSDEGGYSAYCDVTVKKTPDSHVSVQSVSVDNSQMTIYKEYTDRCSCKVYPSDASNKQVTWSSSDPYIASVSGSGDITGNNLGTATITVRTNENNCTSICIVTVIDVPTAKKKSTAATTTNSAAYDHSFMYNTTLSILQAKPNGVVQVTGLIPMAYDRNVAAALKVRPDVTLSATFPFQGHQFVLTLPPKFDLASQIGTNGYVDWLTLCSLQPQVKLTMVK